MDPLLIILFVILFMLSAFFSGTEIALMSLASHKVEALLKEGRFGAKSLKKIKENNDRLLITILIGNNLVNVYTASLATAIAIGIADSSGMDQAAVIGISTWVITFLLLLFGEIIPKSFATKNAAAMGLLVAPIYKMLMLVLLPAIVVIEGIIKIFSKKDFSEEITEEEIGSFIDMGKNTGTLEHAEHEKLKNVLEFGDILVEEIMTPRVKIEAVSSQISVKETLDYYMEHTHSRLPVYNETIDKIDSFITIRELLRLPEDKQLSDLELPKVIKVPLNQPIDILFETFQKSHKHLAIVIDEYGGVAGLITLEDIVEEIFGEIRDETDKEVDEIKKMWEHKYMIESSVLVEDILEKFTLTLTDLWLDEKEFGWENMSYVLTHRLWRFPNSGEKIRFDIFDEEGQNIKDIEFKILTIEDARIGKIEVNMI